MENHKRKPESISIHKHTKKEYFQIRVCNFNQRFVFFSDSKIQDSTVIFFSFITTTITFDFESTKIIISKSKPVKSHPWTARRKAAQKNYKYVIENFVSCRALTESKKHDCYMRGWIRVCKSADPCLLSPNPSIRQFFLFKSETTLPHTETEV